MANTKNYTEHGGSTTHIGGELVLDPGSKVIKNGQEIDIGGGLPPTEGSGKVLVSVNGEWKEQDGYGYTEIGEEMLTDETIETLEQYGMICGNFEEPFVIEEDTEYTIWFNGTKYVVTSVYDSVDTLQSYIGDYIIEEDKFDFSRYPFGIGEFGHDLVLVTESAGTYDIAVSVGGAEIVHKINEKYLPSGGGITVVHATPKEGSDVDMEIDVPYEDLFENPSSYVIEFGEGGSRNYYYYLVFSSQSQLRYQLVDINSDIFVATIDVFNEDDHVEYHEKVIEF